MDLLNIIACPRDQLSLNMDGGRLSCANGHSYPIVDGIPVLLVPELARTAPGERVHPAIERTLQEAENPGPDPFHGEEVHPLVQAMVAGTNGFMYAGVTLTSYPIPTLRLGPGEGHTLLDVGCNWGRWTVAAAKLGYCAVGLDPHLMALRAARHVARTCGVEAQFVCGDARALPFARSSFDHVFSYSVVQHFSKAEARTILTEVARVLRPGGETLVQMPNRRGIRSFYHLARRGFAAGMAFDVRYYTPHELVTVFRSTIGPSKLSVDGFFGLGIQPSDIDIMPLHRRLVIHASELMRRAARRRSWLANFADSLYVTSKKPMAVTQP